MLFWSYRPSWEACCWVGGWSETLLFNLSILKLAYNYILVNNNYYLRLSCTRQSLQCACAVAIFCTARLFWDVPLAGAHAGTLAGAHAGTLTGTLAGTRNWSGCSSNCWAVTTTPQIWEAGRPRPQEKGVTFTGTNTGTEAGNFDSPLCRSKGILESKFCPGKCPGKCPGICNTESATIFTCYLIF